VDYVDYWEELGRISRRNELLGRILRSVTGWNDWRGRCPGELISTTLALSKGVEEVAGGSVGNDKEPQAERTAWR
jgi:hypothetical protein